MKRFLLLLLCVVCMSSMTVYSKDVEEPKNLYAQAAVLMDADSGRILFAKNSDRIMAMASTTKIMTCIIALEDGKLTDVVKVSENASIQPKVHLGMSVGESYILEDLLYSLMLESHNDSAVAIAEHVGGTVEGFAKLMNNKAEEIGCSNTYYITPNGLDASDDIGMHSTTAVDLAKVMSYCISKSEKKEEFLRITQTSNYTFSNVEQTRSFSCDNHNSFLTMMEGALSGKTGFTNNAGYCYVGALKRDGRTFVVSLLACGWPNNQSYKWKDTMKLMEYAVNNYRYENIYEEIEFSSILVKNGVSKTAEFYDEAYVRVEARHNQESELKILKRSDEKIEVKIEVAPYLSAPVQKGTSVGYVKYYLNDSLVAEDEIVTSESIEEKNFVWYFKMILKNYFAMH